MHCDPIDVDYLLCIAIFEILYHIPDAKADAFVDVIAAIIHDSRKIMA